ncbi:GNAT family N-acetyltransferase [Haloterrigena alkaliphila]|uniref:GNAT family N-acetyltransferase n=1 Tax=Haloterrigena alkaliphila TaxID=2816475 RepID=A0A8A2V7S7_9EURY|nr:GNAT family N-acetyltransferase [Haloterrigena alkaliphila]QSW97893.1 GNAT family N-acetyltransferase [Haloterrigena alkaliphila]
MSVQPGISPADEFEDDLQRTIYEYVERNGAVAPAELAGSIRIDAERPQSKPARSGEYTESVCPPAGDLESCLEDLKERGYLTESDGKVRVALSGTATELDHSDGTVTIRPAREEDRDGVVETMREVADGSTYIVADDVATRLDRDSALVRANGEVSRVFFTAVFDPESDGETADGGASRVVGWVHVDAPELPALRHTVELTAGVDPEFRRNGIGSSLLEYGLEWATDAGYEKVYQNLPATNEKAIEFLEENGWQREGVHEGQYCIDGEYVDEVMLATWP